MFRLLLVVVAAAFLATSSDAFAAACGPSNAIKRIRNTKIGGSEYLVFKFHMPPTVPVYAVTVGHPPFIHDASGQTIAVGGSHFIQVQFQGVFWTCTIQEQLTLPRPLIKDIKNIGQFEGVITYAIGLSPQAPYITTYHYPSGPASTTIVLKFHH
jgi:hypothetical protein